ncbi:Uncharacterised protein [Burkholderia pseudomallei]|nr:Uncharacterised protein [Burkholderia pseudomallei]CAJ2930321.1 Uncharacterised protein [Burkholderia pseudomallei]CAJ4699924.1 Uncharacterised protein [Burkholderia pseudomallei]CAJ5358019.1 Uncharacterised protein [Burkholderia pseudomallei]CAJ6753427.1 Uncharacterised protein [Burkholderia pseudomallei]
MGRGSWVAMGPLILSIASSVFGRAHCAAARHSSLVTRHSSVVGCRLSVVGCRLSVVVHRCSSSLVQRRPDRLDRTNCSVRCATRLALFHIFCWQACGHPAHQAINPLMCKRFCDDVTNASIAARMRIARAARRRTRRSVHVDGSGRARRTTPTALGDHDRFPQFLLASLWTSWVRSAQPVDPARFCRIGRINGSRCRSMPRVPARRAFGRTPLAGLRASAHRIAAALVHIFCGQACGHPTHPPHNPLIRRHFSRHARKEATRPPRTNRRAPPRPRP